MWTLLNQTGADIVVSDIPMEQTLSPYGSGEFLLRDVLSSRVLAQNLANGTLVVTSMSSFSPVESWAPVTYVANDGSAQVTAAGQTNAFTLGVFGSAVLYVDVSQISGTLTLSYAEFDGQTDYPAQSLLSTTATGPQTPTPIASLGLSGRILWSLSAGGSATFRAMLLAR